MDGHFRYDDFGDCTLYFIPYTLEDHYFIQTILKFMDFEIFGSVIQEGDLYKVKIYSSKMSREAKQHFKQIQKIFDNIKL